MELGPQFRIFDPSRTGKDRPVGNVVAHPDKVAPTVATGHNAKVVMASMKMPRGGKILGPEHFSDN